MNSRISFKAVNWLVTFLISGFISLNAHATAPTLLDPDEVAAQWTTAEALAFNVGQRKLTGNQNYDQLSPEKRAAAFARLCQYVDVMLNKINQIDLSQDSRRVRCGFIPAKQRLEQIACRGNEDITVQELNRRHDQFLRASGAISTSEYVVLGSDRCL